MKKYRVTKPDGTHVIIEALNMEDAITKARAQFGKLPNDINNEILNEVSTVLSALGSQLDEASSHIRDSKKSLCWEDAYKSVKDLSKRLADTSEAISKKVGSMVKINK